MTLRPMSPALMSAVLAADWAEAESLLGIEFPPEWRADDWEWLAHHAAKVEHDQRFIAWGPRLLIAQKSADARSLQVAVIGEAGFHGPPAPDGTVEIGYMIVTEHRRQGFAEEAASALMRWAMAQHGVAGFKAMVDPTNDPSSNLLRKLGFTEAGRYQHERLGEQLVFRRDTSPLT